MRESANRGRHGKRTLRPEPITVTDRRRIDPDTGQVRGDAPPSPALRGKPGLDNPAPRQTGDISRRKASDSTVGFGGAEADRIAELTDELHQLQAEYANYRRRVERDRTMIADNAKATAAAQFLDILDDLDWAHEHGDTAREPLHSIARKIRTILARMDVTAFGEHGDRFDPTLHEAATAPGRGTDLVVDTVLRPGYTFGEHRVLRTALVTVIDRDYYEHEADIAPAAP